MLHFSCTFRPKAQDREDSAPETRAETIDGPGRCWKHDQDRPQTATEVLTWLAPICGPLENMRGIGAAMAALGDGTTASNCSRRVRRLPRVHGEVVRPRRSRASLLAEDVIELAHTVPPPAPILSKCNEDDDPGLFLCFGRRRRHLVSCASV